MDEEKNTRRGKAIFWTVYAFVGLRAKPPRVFALSSLNTSPKVYAWRDMRPADASAAALP